MWLPFNHMFYVPPYQHPCHNQHIYPNIYSLLIVALTYRLRLRCLLPVVKGSCIVVVGFWGVFVAPAQPNVCVSLPLHLPLSLHLPGHLYGNRYHYLYSFGTVVLSMLELTRLPKTTENLSRCQSAATSNPASLGLCSLSLIPGS